MLENECSSQVGKYSEFCVEYMKSDQNAIQSMKLLTTMLGQFSIFSIEFFITTQKSNSFSISFNSFLYSLSLIQFLFVLSISHSISF